MDVVPETPQCPGLCMFTNDWEKVLVNEKSVTNFVVGASTDCEKVNTASIDENLFRLVPGARICARAATKKAKTV